AGHGNILERLESRVPVLWVNQLPIGQGIRVKRGQRSFADGLESGTNVSHLLSVRIHGPEYFLNVFRHLPKALLTLLQNLPLLEQLRISQSQLLMAREAH